MEHQALLAEYRRLARSDPAAARRVARRYHAQARREGDRVHEARAATLLAEIDLTCGKPRDAAAGFERAAQGLRRAGSTPVPALVGLVQARALLGEAAPARRAIAALRRAARDPLPRAWAELSIGNALGTLGDERGSERAYREALAILGRRRRPEGVVAARATARLHLGVRLARRGAIDDAVRELGRAAAELEGRSMTLPAAVARHNRGWALGVGGDALAAMEELEAALERFEAAGDRRRAALVRVDLAELRGRFSDHARAAAGARAAAQALEAAPPDRARALLVAARAAAAEGRRAVARRMATRAGGLFTRAGDPAGAALARVLLGENLANAERTLRARGHWIGALEALLARVRAVGPARGARLLRERWTSYPRALRRWLEPERAVLAARAAGGGARIRGLRRAVDAVESLRARAPSGALRATVLVERLGVYADLARDLLARGRPADRREAFLVLDAARARTLREEIGREAPGILETPRARAARRRLEFLWGTLEARERGPGDLRGGSTPLLHAIARAEREWVETVESARAAVPARPRATLLPGGACLAFDVLDHAVVGFLARDGGVHAWSCGDVAAVRADLDAFAFQVARRIHGASDAAAADACLARLGARLLGPAPALPEGGLLGVVLPPALGDLPVAALPVSGRALIERCDVYQAPVAAGHRPLARPGGTLLVGIEDEALPDVRREIGWLSRRVPGATRLEGGNAGREAILAALEGHGTVHLAGHAESRADLPLLSALPLRDGRLTAADLAASRLRGTLIVLSACRTGDPSLRWRGETMAGFPRALLAAGADAVVASRWEVPDGVAFAWTRALYPRLLADPPVRAFAAAARALKREFVHPADWAAFLVIRPGTIEEERS